MNKAILIGNLGQDAELKYTNAGTAVMNFRMAVTETWTKDGEKKERTEWFTCVMWGRRAEGVSKYMTKGIKLAVEGRIENKSWEDQQGQKRISTQINVDNLHLLSKAPRRDDDEESYL
jgi:single-strand DNA-binding protein